MTFNFLSESKLIFSRCSLNISPFPQLFRKKPQQRELEWSINNSEGKWMTYQGNKRRDCVKSLYLAIKSL